MNSCCLCSCSTSFLCLFSSSFLWSYSFDFFCIVKQNTNTTTINYNTRRFDSFSGSTVRLREVEAGAEGTKGKESNWLCFISNSYCPNEIWMKRSSTVISHGKDKNWKRGPSLSIFEWVQYSGICERIDKGTTSFSFKNSFKSLE